MPQNGKVDLLLKTLGTIDIDKLDGSNEDRNDAEDGFNNNDDYTNPDDGSIIQIDNDLIPPTIPKRTKSYLTMESPDQYVKRIDYVLVYRNRPNNNYETPQNFEVIRTMFETNLEMEGLILRHVNSTVENEYCFVHIYANWDVLSRYAEVMALRMPMKTIKSNLKILFDEDCNKETKAFTTIFTRDKEYLFDIPEHDREEFFSPSQRTEIIDFILRRTRFNDRKDVFSIGINKLLSDSVYVSAYPLHDDSKESLVSKNTSKRGELLKQWATIRRCFYLQPLNDIVAYFGVKISMYFAWVGFYTYMLVPAALMGILCVVYGGITMSSSEVVKDVCNHPNTEWMCPICALKCNYTRIAEGCTETKASYAFGNVTTIVFAIFISVWATIYLELWKRYSAKISHQWDLSDFSTVDEYPRPEFLANLSKSKKRRLNPVTRIEEPYIPFIWGRLPYFLVSSSLVFMCISIAILIMVSIIIYRVSVQIALIAMFNSNHSSLTQYSFLQKYGDIMVTATAATINLCLILLLSWVYKNLAYFFTEMEKPRTQIEFDNSLTLKMFLFEFVNYYSSFFYIAFFKGRFKLDPPEGGLRAVSHNYLVESCPVGGCYFDLVIQMVIIFIGKAVIGAGVEYLWPYLQSIYNRRRYLATNSTQASSNNPEQSKLEQWEEDFLLESWNHMSLFYEYLELVIQFGFVTLFVSAFPLAPLFALINNIFEIRLDARKMLYNYKRPVAQRVKNIGIWYAIMDAIGKISVFTNSMIIAFTTDIIPQLVYYFNNNYSMNGYFNSTLSVYEITKFDPSINVNNCVYAAYRNPPDSPERYEFTSQHWRMLIYKIIFVVAFQNVVAALNSFLKWVIPDEPRQLRLQKRQHLYLTNELIIRNELSKNLRKSNIPNRKVMSNIEPRFIKPLG